MSSELREELACINPEAMIADGLDGAMVGYTMNHHQPVVAVYDYDKCVKILVNRDGMSDEDANEFLHFNTLGAYVGPDGPLFIKFAETP